MTNLILLSVSLVFIATYLTAYILQRGIPTSISDTYYHNERKWLFSTVVAVSGCLAWLPFLSVTPELWQFLPFLIVASLLFVAASPAFKEDLVSHVHAISAIILGIAAVTWVSIVAWLPFATIAGIAIGIFHRKHFVFWLEIGILVDLYVNLFVLLHICSSAGA